MSDEWMFCIECHETWPEDDLPTCTCPNWRCELCKTNDYSAQGLLEHVRTVHPSIYAIVNVSETPNQSWLN